jgi:hypothetical protein
MKRVMLGVVLIASVAWSGPSLLAFCGFYVAKADAQLFNKASQVVLVRDGDRTVLTMANDFKGDPKEFAIVIPVPVVLEREQIHVGDRALVEHVDAYSAPRLVEYFDENPCMMLRENSAGGGGGLRIPAPAPVSAAARAQALGVTIEAQYTVGEYDILILSATESTGLETWLRESGYRIPAGASSVLSSYLRQNMKFFVAKVNLGEQAKLGYSMLRPIQVAFESPKFMLPIRLGMVNADGPQELFVYTLTRQGRVETTNYRTTKLPAGMDIPLFVKDKFGDFYKAMFAQSVKKEDMSTVFTEYAWDTSWCDPCAANPLTTEELRKLGVFWLDGGSAGSSSVPGTLGASRPPAQQQVYLTRLHVRYDKAHFPEDLVFQETSDRTNFQGRYVLRHPWTGEDACTGAAQYRSGLPQRFEQEAQNLASLTGWDLTDIRRQMRIGEPVLPWWRRIWGK